MDFPATLAVRLSTIAVFRIFSRNLRACRRSGESDESPGRAACLRILLVLLAGFPASGSAQNAPDSLRLIQTLPVDARYAVADNLSNIYLITPDNAVEKYAPDGRLLARYTNNRLSRAALLDVSNPLKVLVWYPDFRTAVFLDRSLTVLGELNLIGAGYPEVRQIAASQDGNVWIYDEENFRLVKITPEGAKRFESQAMNQLEPAPRSVSCLRENNDRVYLADSTQGIFVFDVFAQFDRFWSPLHPVKDFQVAGDELHYLHGKNIMAERLLFRASRQIDISSLLTSSSVAMLSPRRLLLAGEGRIAVYGY